MPVEDRITHRARQMLLDLDGQRTADGRNMMNLVYAWLDENTDDEMLSTADVQNGIDAVTMGWPNA